MVYIKETFLDGQSIKIKVDGILDESSVPLLDDLCCIHLREEKKIFIDLKSIISICREGLNLLQRMQEKVTFLDPPPLISLKKRVSNRLEGKKLIVAPDKPPLSCEYQKAIPHGKGGRKKENTHFESKPTLLVEARKLAEKGRRLEVTAKGPQKKQLPIKEGLFTWPSDHPQLIGSKCKKCGEVAFPAQKGCPACTGEDVENILLSTRGTLWTWTIQAVLPPSPPYARPDTPDNFVPYGVGYVEHPEGVRVESRLTENDPAKLKSGMEMELVIEKFKEDKDGNDLMTFAFKPVGK